MTFRLLRHDPSFRMPDFDPSLLSKVAACGLTGRGGAAFCTAVKLQAVKDQPGPGKVVVANGSEGEPGSIKDRYLLANRTGLVLEGLLHAAQIVGAERHIVYVTEAAAASSVKNVAARLGLDRPIEVVLAPQTYVAGEETAVVGFLDGRGALPSAKPPRPHEKGVGGAPTLILNVETLAELALVARGEDGFGTRLVSVSGAGLPTILSEIPVGTTLGELAAAHGVEQITGAFPSGMFGGIVGPEAVEHMVGGSGTVRLIGPDECPVRLAAEAVAFLTAESSQQCGICVMGTRAMNSGLDDLVACRASTEEVGLLGQRAVKLPGRGACGLLDAAASIAATLLTGFPDQVTDHLSGSCALCPT